MVLFGLWPDVFMPLAEVIRLCLIFNKLLVWHTLSSSLMSGEEVVFKYPPWMWPIIANRCVFFATPWSWAGPRCHFSDYGSVPVAGTAVDRVLLWWRGEKMQLLKMEIVLVASLVFRWWLFSVGSQQSAIFIGKCSYCPLRW
jgi:hypothetical protein